MAKNNSNQSISGIWTMLGVVGFIVLLLACASMIFPARREYNRQLKYYSQVQAAADRKRAERDALQKEVAALESSPTAIEKVARESFRYCKKDEIIIYHTDKR